jgi:hypothetical protein
VGSDAAYATYLQLQLIVDSLTLPTNLRFQESLSMHRMIIKVNVAEERWTRFVEHLPKFRLVQCAFFMLRLCMETILCKVHSLDTSFGFVFPGNGCAGPHLFSTFYIDTPT